VDKYRKKYCKPQAKRGKQPDRQFGFPLRPVLFGNLVVYKLFLIIFGIVYRGSRSISGANFNEADGEI